jgi:hypothetical protein
VQTIRTCLEARVHPAGSRCATVKPQDRPACPVCMRRCNPKNDCKDRHPCPKYCVAPPRRVNYRHSRDPHVNSQDRIPPRAQYACVIATQRSELKDRPACPVRICFVRHHCKPPWTTKSTFTPIPPLSPLVGHRCNKTSRSYTPILRGPSGSFGVHILL